MAAASVITQNSWKTKLICSCEYIQHCIWQTTNNQFRILLIVIDFSALKIISLYSTQRGSILLPGETCKMFSPTTSMYLPHHLASPRAFHVLPCFLSLILSAHLLSPSLPPLPSCVLSASWSLTNPSCCFTPGCVEKTKNICVWSWRSQKATLQRTKEIAGQLK